MLAAAMDSGSTNVDTEMEIIKSRFLAERMAKRLTLLINTIQQENLKSLNSIIKAL